MENYEVFRIIKQCMRSNSIIEQYGESKSSSYIQQSMPRNNFNE